MKKEKAPKLVVKNLVLQLYVSGMSAKSMEAIENIKRLCNDHLENAFELEIIDIYKNPESSIKEHIVFSPSLIKRFPLPKKTLIGTLSDTKKVVNALGITLKNKS
ncbi:MAG: circadian clock KaiB family protein [Chitinophagales bacterium]